MAKCRRDDEFVEIKAELFKIIRAYQDKPVQGLLNAIKKHFKQDEMEMVKIALVELCDKIMED
jgi:hypothetical protein